MPRRSFRAALVVVGVTFLILAGAGAWLWSEITAYPERRHPGSGKSLVVEIPSGVSLPRVARILDEADVIERPTWFRYYAMHRGLSQRVRAGKYELRDDMTPREVLDTLIRGVPEKTVEVVLPEGRNILEVFETLADAGVADAGALEKLCRNPGWLKEHGIADETCEGYLFPDTYQFRTPTDPEAVLDRLVKRHRQVYAELKKKHEKSAERLAARLHKALAAAGAPSARWGDREFVVMASIVEKEAVVPEERPVIASVFYNRLTSPRFASRRLETDPTIRYGCLVPEEKTPACQDWDKGRLRRKQLDDADNLYNTYQHAFLPPGPIGNPGRASLEAALSPAKTDYFYFVAREDRRHHVFSRTFAEHTRWVNKYQR